VSCPLPNIGLKLQFRSFTNGRPRNLDSWRLRSVHPAMQKFRWFS
jgi:hypothetical protein